MSPSLLNSSSGKVRGLLGSLCLLLLPLLGWGQVNIAGGGTITENFNNATALAQLSTTGAWKIDAQSQARTFGTYAAASTTPTNTAGAGLSSTGASGNYAFTSSSTASDRAMGGLSATSSNRTSNVYTYLRNNGTTDIASFSISYNIEKYRTGSQANGFTIKMYSSTDGNTWVAATDAGFTTNFTADATTANGPATVPIPPVTAAGGTLTQTVAANGVIYLMWSYSVTSGTNGGNAQALGIDDVSIAAVSAAAPTGTITATPTTTFTAFTTQQGTPSAAQTYALTGSGLTTDITVTAPTGYVVAQSASSTTTAPGTYAATQTVTQASGSASATIYVRLSGTTAGIYGTSTTPVNVTNASSGATTQNVAVYGNTTNITTSVTSLTAFSTAQGTPSTAQSYTLNGAGLTSTLLVSAPSGFEVSQTSATTGFAATQSLTPSTAGVVATTTIYVRLTGAATGSFGGDVTNASTGATTRNVTVSGTVTPAPVLTVTPGSLSGFSTTVGSPSTAQSYVLTGTDVTAPVTVTPPTGYAVSLDNSSFSTSNVSVTAAAVNGSGQTIYVRLTGASVGSPAGNVTNATTGATTVNVAVSGTVAAAPLLAVSPTSLSGFNALAGTASASQNYTLTGSNLTANVLVTAPTGYELSQDGGATYATAQTVVPSSGSVNTPIAVRLAASASAGTVSGNVTNTSTGATARSVAVSGRVVAKPTGTPAITSVSTTFNSATINLTAADGTNLLVVVRPTGSTATAPTDGTTYTGNAAYGSGSALGSGFVVFAAANAASVTVTNLNGTTTYVADVYTYNVGTVAGFENYGLNSGTATFTTPAQPQAAAGQLALEENFDYPDGTALVASGAAGTADPTTRWYQNGTTATNPVTTATGNLGTASQQYPRGVQSASPAGASSQVPLTTSGQDVFKFLTQPTGATASYGAALVTVNTVQATGDYFLHFISGATATSATNNRARVYAKAVSGSTTTFNFGIGITNEAATYGTAAYTLGATYLVVFKYENSTATGGFDAATLFALDPTVVPTTEPASQVAGLAVPTITSATTGNAQATINAVALRQGTAASAPSVTVDNLRVGSGWGTAVGRVVYGSGTSTVVAGDYYSLTVTGSGTVATVSTTGPGNGVTAANTVVLEKRLNLNGGQVAVPAATPTTNPLLLRNRGLGDSFEILADGGTSYVDGPVSRETVGGPSLLFPIGRNGNYRPLTLNINTAPSGTTIYTAVQTDASAYSADATVLAPLTRVSRIRYFSIVPNPVPAAGAFTGSVALSFGTDDQVTDPSQATFVVAKSDGQGWSSIGRQGNSSTTLTSNSFADFSFFSLASSSPAVATNPLPVVLTRFTASRTPKGVQVAWATASELNSDKFVVERSFDGKAFVDVASVKAQGSTREAHDYASLDASAPAALLYYRLRQVDTDGSVAYSPAVTVAAREGATAEIALSPNPAHESISLLTEQPTAYVVRNSLGQLVRSGTTAVGTTTVPVAELANGIYFFELHTGTGRVVRKFVKE